MYSMAHFGVSAPIVLISFAISPNFTGVLVGGLLGAASHYPVDYLNESSIGKFFSTGFIKWDTMLIGLTFVFGAFMGFHFGGWIGMLILLGLLWYGLACGILMDLIDTKLGLTMRYPEKYKRTYYFHKQKKFIQCSVFWSKVAQLIGFILVIISIIIYINYKY